MGVNLGEGNGVISEINVTPLVDVMLVLLVIFMITATIIRETPALERATEVDLPVTRYNDAAIDVATTDKLILVIDDNMRMYLGDELITDCSAALDRPTVEAMTPCLLEVGRKLGQNAKLALDREIYILADTDVPYGFVNGAMAQIRNAGVHRVGMITNPEYRQATE
jgi:biopolymer transport protein TolR